MFLIPFDLLMIGQSCPLAWMYVLLALPQRLAPIHDLNRDLVAETAPLQKAQQATAKRLLIQTPIAPQVLLGGLQRIRLFVHVSRNVLDDAIRHAFEA
jgi:hypothetical protein